MEFKKGMTNGEIYGPAMKITDQKEADQYFEDLVNFFVECFGKQRDEAIPILKENLGYWAGYYDNETMERVNRLFCTEHPVFGRKFPTAEEAFVAGKGFAQGYKAGKNE